MGFDVIYFPPIHPIGLTNRKGRNNSVTCQPGEPGVPYAIGNRHLGCPNGGGHKDIEPSLGTFEDFAWLEKEIRRRGMEIALDFAINCSPDHPYVAEHPEWFYKRPDGTIKYAENPPKKYEDIYPLNFRCTNWPELWEEMKSIILFWAERGVRIFRVDNPHTKPVAFWEFLIAGVREKFPDTIFLSEAFTRPKMMKVLARAGFTQSYTYFTWRTSKQELTEYFTELTQTEMRQYFRGNLFTNTPDILPFHLQTGGPPMFRIRAVLAATLSSVYGIYSGFELCENAALPGREEYLDSEKYQLKERDWDAPGNIKALITQLNRIRRENRALHFYDNLRFHPVDNEALLFYSKTDAGAGQHHPGDRQSRSGPDADRLRRSASRTIRGFRRRQLRSARSPDRCALRLAWETQLRRAPPRCAARPYLSGAAVVIQASSLIRRAAFQAALSNYHEKEQEQEMNDPAKAIVSPPVKLHRRCPRLC